MTPTPRMNTARYTDLGIPDQGRPCACEPTRPCLFHYDRLPADVRHATRRTAGVRSHNQGERR